MAESNEKCVTDNSKLESCEHFILNDSESSASIVNDDLEAQPTLMTFKEELAKKRELRQNAISDMKNEIRTLRMQLDEERRKPRFESNAFSNDYLEVKCCTVSRSIQTDSIEENQNAEIHAIAIQNKMDLEHSLTKSILKECQSSLSKANTEIVSLSNETVALRNQAISLKDVIVITKQMVKIREDQVKELKNKINEIEESLAEHDVKILAEDLRREYERQMANIKELRTLYEERARASNEDRNNLLEQLRVKSSELDAEIKKNNELKDRESILIKDAELKEAELTKKRNEIQFCNYENMELRQQLSVINQLFTQVILGFNTGKKINIDRLGKLLEENRELLHDMTNYELLSSEAANFPKLLFDLISEAGNESVESSFLCNKNDLDGYDNSEPNQKNIVYARDDLVASVSTTQEIMLNLPKVWRVLFELLSHHQKIKPVLLTDIGDDTDCYKSIQTPTGPKLVPSVSKTYIKLKDLILEKRSIMKEQSKLKNLNSHLERILNDQEKRLGAVSIELTKTWHLVGRMQRQHRQLHTHEQILRYQLNQKRRMLNDLKDELEYCRRKWALAREKNNESEVQWKSLRTEFTNRKLLDPNTSGESGYSDDLLSDEDDCSDSSCDQKRNKESKPLNPALFLYRQKSRVQSLPPLEFRISNEFRKRSSSSPATFSEQKMIYSIEMTADNIKHNDISQKKLDDDSLGTKPKTLSLCTNKLLESNKSMERMDNVLENEHGKTDIQITHTLPDSDCEQKCSQLRDTQCNDASNSKYELKLGATLLNEMSNEFDTDKELTINVENDDIALFGENFLRLAENYEPDASTSINQSNTVISNMQEMKNLTPLEKAYLESRADRLKKLEEQCADLKTQMENHSTRNENMQTGMPSVFQSSLESSLLSEIDEHESATTSQHVAIPLTTDSANNSKGSIQPEAIEPNFLTATEMEYLQRREDRLKRLEEQCLKLKTQMTRTANRGNHLSNQLSDLHHRSHSNEPLETDITAVPSQIADHPSTSDVLDDQSDT